jgi:hypothetical protein
MRGRIEEHREMHMGGYWIDIPVVGFFILGWTVYAVTPEHSAYGLVRLDGGRGERDVAQTVRLECLAGDGQLTIPLNPISARNRNR